MRTATFEQQTRFFWKWVYGMSDISKQSILHSVSGSPINTLSSAVNSGLAVFRLIFNHTTEGDQYGTTYSEKGVDNSAYYLLTPDLQNYINDAGAGNVMRTSFKLVRKLVLDSLRYWVQEMHVDGFRFDLATIFTRNDDGSVNTTNPPILEEIFMDPILSGVRLIAEPWDMDSYQLGTLFPGTNLSQWNGQYRDNLRQFVKGDNNTVAALMTRVYGSTDLFPPQIPYSAKPYQTINFINSHDGFTLYDLVSYNDKHNQANGYNNTDGTDSNFSWNCGMEGESDTRHPAASAAAGQELFDVANFFQWCAHVPNGGRVPANAGG
jgi:isoamylase